MSTPSGRLDGRTTLITGGTSGIGEACVRRFVAEGARVVFTGRRTDAGERVAAETGARFIAADHGTLPGCRESTEAAVEALDGRLDILFNNAGIVTRGTIDTTTEEVWEETFRVNVTGVWRMCREVVPVMRAQGGGVIVNNASDWGLVGGTDAVAYCASKGAVVQLTRALALDHATDGIRVNAVCPGDTFVERWVERGDFEGAPSLEEGLAAMGASLPMGRVGRVEEIVEGVLFLASDASSYMTGQMLVLDGGNSAG